MWLYYNHFEVPNEGRYIYGRTLFINEVRFIEFGELSKVISDTYKEQLNADKPSKLEFEGSFRLIRVVSIGYLLPFLLLTQTFL